MTVWELVGLVGLVVAGTVDVCFAAALLTIALDALWDDWALWRTKRRMARERRDLGAPPGV